MAVIYACKFQSTRDHLLRVMAGATPDRVRAAIKAGMTPYEPGKRRKWRPLASRSRRKR